MEIYLKNRRMPHARLTQLTPVKRTIDTAINKAAQGRKKLKGLNDDNRARDHEEWAKRCQNKTTSKEQKSAARIAAYKSWRDIWLQGDRKQVNAQQTIADPVIWSAAQHLRRQKYRRRKNELQGNAPLNSSKPQKGPK
ncbi:hypothetical protein K3495_g11190 [Podosphaera aphanis]|nr:hypothetical protein K3495_g11190 [Podosphaera aphanis]